MLFNALKTAAYSGMSDADAATALSIPTYTPRVGPITITTLAGSDSWGFAKATAVLAAFQSVANSGGASGAQASALIAILTGPGLLASDPQIPALAPAFVALAGGVLTDADIPPALGTATYPCGGPVATSDVTAARAAIAYQSSVSAISQQWANVYNAGASILGNLQPGQPVPTLAELIIAAQA